MIPMERMLCGTDDLTNDIVESGIVSWKDLIRTVRLFHYGRNQNRKDFNLVWTERKGTCSSKHAFLKMVAELNGFDSVELFIGIYKMNIDNTPGSEAVLRNETINYIPEAHCYLKVDGVVLDVTNSHSDFKTYSMDILEEIPIDKEVVISDKIELHKDYIRDWIKKETINYSFEKIWDLREKCIEALENK